MVAGQDLFRSLRLVFGYDSRLTEGTGHTALDGLSSRRSMNFLTFRGVNFLFG